MADKVDLKNGYALLVGVESYRSYSSGGDKDLPAGWNDVLAFWTLCRRLGFAPENIRVLVSADPTSPAHQALKGVKSTYQSAEEATLKELSKRAQARGQMSKLSNDEERDTLKTGFRSLKQNFFKSLELGLHGRDEVHYREAEVRSAELNYFTRVKKNKKPMAEAEAALESWLPNSQIIQAARSSPAAAPSHANIIEEIKKMVQHGKDFPGAPLLLTYSGHGARMPDGDLALCPEDVGPGLKNAIPFAMLCSPRDDQQALNLGQFDNLTIVLDCCDAAASGRHDDLHSTSLLSPGAPEEAKESFAGFSGRVLCASERDEHAYQAVFGERWHGAFTWAVTTALWQWRMKEHGGDLALDTVSYGRLLDQAAGLLARLGYEQHPQLLSKDPEVNERRVFQAESALLAGDHRPSGKRREGQLVPDFKYTLTFKPNGDKEVKLAEVVVCRAGTPQLNNAAKTYGADTEVWYLFEANLAKLTSGGTLKVETTDWPSTTRVREAAAGSDEDWKKSKKDIKNGYTPPPQYPVLSDYYFSNTELAVRLNVATTTDKKTMTLHGVTWAAKGQPTSRLDFGKKVGSSSTLSATTAEKLTDWYALRSW